jgi:hypothetical protein
MPIKWAKMGLQGQFWGFFGGPRPFGDPNYIIFEEKVFLKKNILAHFGPKGLGKKFGLGQNKPK